MRLAYLDGMRGLFALSVAVYHVFLFFLPAAITGNRETMHLLGDYEMILSELPQFLYNGNCGVCVFFVLSGFVLSCRYWENRQAALLTSAALRRYVRLTLPALASILLAYLLLAAGWMRTQEIFPVASSFPIVEQLYWFPANLWEALEEGVWGIYFSYDMGRSYNPVLWTMEVEMKGSFLSFAFLSIFGKVSKRWVLYALMVLLFWKTYYLAFVLGVALSDLAFSSEGRWLWDAMGRKGLTAASLGMGVLLSSYIADDRHDVFRWMRFSAFDAFQANSEVFYHVLGAAFLIYAVLRSPMLQACFQTRFFSQLGRYSFAVYLVHVPVYSSLGSVIFLALLRHGWGYGASVGFAVAACVPVIALLAWGMRHFVEEAANRLARRMEGAFLG